MLDVSAHCSRIMRLRGFFSPTPCAHTSALYAPRERGASGHISITRQTNEHSFLSIEHSRRCERVFRQHWHVCACLRSGRSAFCKPSSPIHRIFLPFHVIAPPEPFSTKRKKYKSSRFALFPRPPHHVPCCHFSVSAFFRCTFVVRFSLLSSSFIQSRSNMRSPDGKKAQTQGPRRREECVHVNEAAEEGKNAEARIILMDLNVYTIRIIKRFSFTIRRRNGKLFECRTSSLNVQFTCFSFVLFAFRLPSLASSLPFFALRLLLAN